MGDNIFERLTAEEQNNLWMYMIFNRDKIIEKTEQWTKEAEEAGMTLTEYLESISPLNDKGKLSWLGKNCKDCGNEKCKEFGKLPKGYDCALWQPKMENYSIKTVTNAKDAENYPISEDISKGIEEINKLIFENGQSESMVEKDAGATALKINPCYCGGEMEIKKVAQNGGMDGTYYNWELTCKKCGLAMACAADGFYGRKYKTYEEVVSDWNQRLQKVEKVDATDRLIVMFDSSLNDAAALAVARGNGKGYTVLKLIFGEQADILYHLLTEQWAKAEIKAESEVSE